MKTLNAGDVFLFFINLALFIVGFMLLSLENWVGMLFVLVAAVFFTLQFFLIKKREASEEELARFRGMCDKRKGGGKPHE